LKKKKRKQKICLIFWREKINYSRKPEDASEFTLYKIEIMQRLSQALISGGKIEIIIEELLTELKRILHYRGYALLLLDKETKQFDFKYTYHLQNSDHYTIQNLIKEGIIDWTLNNGQPILLPRWEENDQLEDGPQHNFFLIPLLVNARKIGIIVMLCSLSPQKIRQETFQLLSLLGKQTAVILENSQLYSHMERRINELSTLFKSSEIINSSLELEQIMNLLLELTLKEVKSEYGLLLLREQRTRKLIPQISKGISLSRIKKGCFSEGKGALGWVAKKGQSLIIDNYQKDIRFQNSGEFLNLVPQAMLIVPLKVRKETIGVLAIGNPLSHPFYTGNDLNIAQSLANQAAIAVKNAYLYQDLQKSLLNIVAALVNAIEAKDKYTRGHSQRVTEYSLRIAKVLGLSKEEMKIIKSCGLIHDIGKIGINDNILHKSSKLNPEEYKIVKRHSVMGEEIIRPVEFLKKGLPVIRHHHERYDGKGYPDGLKGKAIPLLARILAVADSFDAMTSHRPYRKPLSLEESIMKLKEGSGTQFDPEIVKVFLSILKKETMPFFSK